MTSRILKLLLFFNLVLLSANLARSPIAQRVAPQSSARQVTEDSLELARMYQEDQADRAPENEKRLGWQAITARDKVREARVKDLYAKNSLQSGADFYHAAMILQHAELPEDYLLAHEFCVVAISKGEKRAKSLAAKSEDRFLMAIGRPQRFATQFRSDNNGPFKLYQVDPGVTDELRTAMDIPPLAEAKAREAQLNK